MVLRRVGGEIRGEIAMPLVGLGGGKKGVFSRLNASTTASVAQSFGNTARRTTNAESRTGLSHKAQEVSFRNRKDNRRASGGRL